MSFYIEKDKLFTEFDKIQIIPFYFLSKEASYDENTVRTYLLDFVYSG
jgi:hypothetical protein